MEYTINYPIEKQNLKTRYFNTIYIDNKRGILIKKSTEKQKLYNEILWYLKLPKRLQYIAPRILSYSLDYKNLYVCMEYYGYDTINNLLISHEQNDATWDSILKHIFSVLSDMKKYSIRLDPLKSAISINKMYLEKTKERLNTLKFDDKFRPFFNETIVINGKEYRSLEYYMGILQELLVKYNIYEVEFFNIIHGDLCFSNILYDSKNEIIRLIDPRGEFGAYKIYGDTRYDIAKLSHSINGYYDFIVSDLFKVKVQNTNIEYKIFSSPYIDTLQQKFMQYLDKYNFNFKQIKLIESLLFLSMTPLHKNNPSRQYVMLATGVKIIDNLINNIN